jgi:hypothetical protein|tara:strand:- start:52 stop:438 length:387 start_codon:yes stop_codon:yes gene_type:complete
LARNVYTGKFNKKREEKALDKPKKETWKEDEVEPTTRKYQKKSFVPVVSPKKPVNLPREAEIERKIVKKTPTGNPFPSYLPQFKKYSAIFGANPFLKNKTNKTLVATPGKYEIRHDPSLKKVKKAAPV